MADLGLLSSAEVPASLRLPPLCLEGARTSTCSTCETPETAGGDSSMLRVRVKRETVESQAPKGEGPLAAPRFLLESSHRTAASATETPPPFSPLDPVISAMRALSRAGDFEQAAALGARSRPALATPPGTRLEFLEPISEGAQSRVHRARWSPHPVSACALSSGDVWQPGMAACRESSAAPLCSCELLVAVKMPKLRRPGDLDAFLGEVQILERVRHKGVVPLLAAHLVPPRYALILGLGDCSAAQALHRVASRWRPSRGEALLAAQHLAEAVAHVHGLGAIHGDVKLDNVIVSADRSTLWLADFGLAAQTLVECWAAECGGGLCCDPAHARLFSSEARAQKNAISYSRPPSSPSPRALYPSRVCTPLARDVGGLGSQAFAAAPPRRAPTGGRRPFAGTLEYAAPELLEGNSSAGSPSCVAQGPRLPSGLSPASDVYALGVCVNELLGGGVPLADAERSEALDHTVLERGLARPELVRAVCGGLRPTLARGLDGGVRDMILACWSGRPGDRPSAAACAERLRGALAAYEREREARHEVLGQAGGGRDSQAAIRSVAIAETPRPATLAAGLGVSCRTQLQQQQPLALGSAPLESTLKLSTPLHAARSEQETDAAAPPLLAPAPPTPPLTSAQPRPGEAAPVRRERSARVHLALPSWDQGAAQTPQASLERMSQSPTLGRPPRPRPAPAREEQAAVSWPLRAPRAASRLRPFAAVRLDGGGAGQGRVPAALPSPWGIPQGGEGEKGEKGTERANMAQSAPFAPLQPSMRLDMPSPEPSRTSVGFVAPDLGEAERPVAGLVSLQVPRSAILQAPFAQGSAPFAEDRAPFREDRAPFKEDPAPFKGDPAPLKKDPAPFKAPPPVAAPSPSSQASQASPAQPLSIWEAEVEATLPCPAVAEEPPSFACPSAPGGLPSWLAAGEGRSLAARARWGGAAAAGRRGADAMEDRHFAVQLDPGVLLFAVFDGHRGAEAAEFLRLNLPALARRELARPSGSAGSALRAALLRADAAFRMTRAARQVGRGGARRCPGAAALVGLLHGADRLTLANLGDCRAVLLGSARDGAGEEARVLTRDHRASCPRERERLLAAGAALRETAPGVWRVGAEGLALSRSVGDADLKAHGVIAAAETHEVLLGGEGSAHQVLVAASDGVWDALAPEDVAQLARDTARAPDLLARRLCEEAIARGSGDNVAAVVVCV